MEPAVRYKLEIRISIVQLNEHGGYTGDRLSIYEEKTVEAGSFMEIAGILGKFHETADQIKAVDS